MSTSAFVDVRRRSARLVGAQVVDSRSTHQPSASALPAASTPTGAQKSEAKNEHKRTEKRSNRELEEEEEEDTAPASTPKTKRRKVAATSRKSSTTQGADADDPPVNVPRKKKGKSEVEPNPVDFPVRVSSPWKVGAHVSAAGGVENSITNAALIGANAFALFLKSQRKWTGPPLKSDSIAKFKSRLETFGYSPCHILPHGSYLVNLGNPDDEKREKSYQCFLDELVRAEQLGLTLYNFHPGSTVGLTTMENSISLIAQCLNRAHKETKSVVTVIENMAGSGNVIGSSFKDLGDIIKQVEDKARVGVCLDTCHMFAAGYDIRTKQGWISMITQFDEEVGLKYLRGMHLNDSKAQLASKKDRHENIGLGHLSLRAFHHILTDERVQNIPLILETPSQENNDIWIKEVEILNRLSTLKLDEPKDAGGEGDEGGQLLDAMMEEIKEVVKKVTATNPKAAKGGGKGSSKRAVKGRKKAGEEDESELSDLTEDD
ncbi:hypothetical protein JAAARDRAFT_191370 [Jaapia argillacea MUCL 33604]|uniref:Apurinic-apyrimidinic endonuclease 1 n=1 Tax=Jaapia argillacea MUCL 33604 TaxID=933084 RepID=A0A067Q2R2_9AGAM|nr:hypothetical protein JAAARDRAFT_191370 [Jaapia argillacea MUCL 33604]